MGEFFNKLRLFFRWKLFLLTFIPVFLTASLPYLGVSLTKNSIVTPIPEKVDIFDTVIPKLEQKSFDFNIKEERSLISKSYAFDDLENLISYLVIDFDSGKVLAEKEMKKSVSIASLTKIMTAVVSLDLAAEDEYFEVSKRASNIEPTKIGVVPGQKMNLRELINALMLTSANDAAQVIKEGIDQKYKSTVFIRAMNQKAKFLKLESTSFDNPQGFDGNKNYSSAKDLAILTKYAIENYPLIKEVVAKDYEFLPEDQNHKQFDLYNWNGLLGVYPKVSGVKIGNTDDAGRTTIVLSEREGKKVLAISLGAPGILERDLWTAKLLDLGFEEFGMSPVEITKEQLKEKYGSWKYWN